MARRFKQKEKTLHWDMIPYSHLCVTCNNNKDYVSFFVVANASSFTVKSQCNSCKVLGIAKPKNSNGLKLFPYGTFEDVRYDIKHKIDMYFKGVFA